jgi:small subunit ribosomal protein S16
LYFFTVLEEYVVKIRLKRFGTKKRPYYRIVVQDSRQPRDGAAIEEIGFYHPIEAEDKQISLDVERAQYWVGVGAQPSDTVHRLMNKKGMTL